MSKDLELEHWKRKKLLEMQRRLLAKQRNSEVATQVEKADPKSLLDKVLVGRAWEVLEAARRQYPVPVQRLMGEMARLVKGGQLKGPISSEQLLWFFRRLGMNVRLETRIRILESGELKSIADKLRGR